MFITTITWVNNPKCKCTWTWTIIKDFFLKSLYVKTAYFKLQKYFDKLKEEYNIRNTGWFKPEFSKLKLSWTLHPKHGSPGFWDSCCIVLQMSRGSSQYHWRRTRVGSNCAQFSPMRITASMGAEFLLYPWKRLQCPWYRPNLTRKRNVNMWQRFSVRPKCFKLI